MMYWLIINIYKNEMSKFGVDNNSFKPIISVIPIGTKEVFTMNKELGRITAELRSTKMESYDGWCLMRRLVAVFPKLDGDEKTRTIQRIFDLSEVYYGGALFGDEAKLTILGEVAGSTSIETRRMIWNFCLKKLRQKKRFFSVEENKALGGIFSSLPEKDRRREWEELLAIVTEEDSSAPARKFSALGALRYASLDNDEAEVLWVHIHKMLQNGGDDNVVLQIAAKLFSLLSKKEQEEIAVCLKELGVFYLEENRRSQENNYRHIAIGDIFCAIKNIFLSSSFFSEEKKVRADLLSVLKEGTKMGEDKNWIIEDNANAVISRIWDSLREKEKNIFSSQT